MLHSRAVSGGGERYRRGGRYAYFQTDDGSASWGVQDGSAPLVGCWTRPPGWWAPPAPPRILELEHESTAVQALPVVVRWCGGVLQAAALAWGRMAV